MSQDASLLSHLLAGSSQEELFATRGLTYLLKHPACNAALLGKLNQYAKGDDHPFNKDDACRWVEELGTKDSGRPDVTGLIDGRPRIILEGKFWADLTSNQPTEYLRHLQDASDAGDLTACVFVAPPSRLAALWGKLRERLSNFVCEKIETGTDVQWHAVRVTDTASNKQSILLLTHWQAVLDLLSVDSAQQTKEDISQLRALCERQDSVGFREFSDYDLSSAAARKVHQLWKLTDELGRALTAQKIGVQKGNNTADKDGNWFNITINDHVCYITFLPGRWANTARNITTPFWLQICRMDLVPVNHERFKSEKYFVLDDVRNWIFPLHIPIGKEKEDVLLDLTAQVVRITSALKP
jgi:hypothetical protein